MSIILTQLDEIINLIQNNMFDIIFKSNIPYFFIPMCDFFWYAWSQQRNEVNGSARKGEADQTSKAGQQTPLKHWE